MAKITVHRALISKALITIYGRFSWLAFAVVPAKCVLEIGLAYMWLVFDLVSPCRRRRLEFTVVLGLKNKRQKSEKKRKIGAAISFPEKVTFKVRDS